MSTRAIALIASLRLALAATASAVERQILPATVVPLHYEVRIVPDAKALSFAGEVRIDIEVKAATNRIVLNAAELTLDGADAQTEAGIRQRAAVQASVLPAIDAWVAGQAK